METAATKVGEEIVTGVVAPIKRQFSYLSQWHDNLQNLTSKVTNLEDRREDVQHRVNEAVNNLQVIKEGVTNWLEKVEVMKAEAEGLLKDKDNVGNGCWKGWCLNLKLRYQLSRKAVKEASKLDALLAEGEFETVAHPQRPLAVVYEPTRSSEVKQVTCDNKKIDPVVEIEGDEKSENSGSYTAQHVSEGIASSSAGTRGGLESRLLALGEVMAAVRDDQIRIVRICGMGGIGKTTMAKEVEKLAREERLFHEIPMVEITEEPDVVRIQGYLAKSLGLKLEEEDLLGRAIKLRERLNDGNKKILVILDNVWRREDLEEVGIPLGDENSCKILLTSRLFDVCKNIAPEKEVNVEVLPDPEAKVLFAQSLGNAHCYFQIAEEIVKACGGLPIAIKTIARAVANKSKLTWRFALRGLQNPTPSEGGYQAALNSTLKVSYDFLENKEIRKFFRLCCLFPKGFNVPIEDLTRYGIALRLFKDSDRLYKAREEAHVNIETLLKSNLLVGSDEIECVKMHDLVWDFALSITSEGPFMVQFGDGLKEWPKRDSYEYYKSISLECGQMHEPPAELNFHNLEILRLVAVEKFLLLKSPNNFYKGMSGLRVLILSRMDVQLASTSIQHLANLRALVLHGCRLYNDVSMIGNLDHLEVLSFAYSKIKLPKEIGKLRGLRLLDLSGCMLRKISRGVLSGLICLEELYMRGICLEEQCMRGSYWHREKCQNMFTEILSLPKLVVIVIEIQYELVGIDSLFEKVEKFMISIGCRLKNKGYLFQNTLEFNCETNVLLNGGIKAFLGKTENVDLKLGGLNVPLNDSETGQVSNMKTLSVDSCNELVYLVDTMRLHQNNVFPPLESLRLSHLKNLEDIYHVRNSKERFGELTGSPALTNSWMVPTQLASFGNLTVLVVNDCNKLQNVFTLSIARGLVMLKELSIEDCEVMTEIFQEERGRDNGKASVGKIEFRNLKYLSLVRLPNLVGFSKAADAIELPQLEELVLAYLPKITSLCPRTETSASQLDHVSACCPLFNHKGPHTLRGYRNLTSLTVKHCHGLEAIVAAEGREKECATEGILFPKLNHLLLSNLPNLTTIIPKGYTFRWSSLKRLKVKKCGGETDIFANMNSIQNGATGQKLSFSGPQSSNPSAVLLTMEGIGRSRLPAWSLHNLTSVKLNKCHTLSYVFPPNKVVRLPVLQSLSIKNCDCLRYLFCSSTVTSVEQLRELEIIECEMMEVIVKDEDEEEGVDVISKVVFPSLVCLTLKSLPNLGGFCLGELGFEWPSLKFVEVRYCWKMGIFTSGYSDTPILGSVLINSKRHILVEGDLNTTLTSVLQKNLDNIALKEEGILTFNGFLLAGECLASQCPSWSWQSGEPSKTKLFLPGRRQFLISRNVPCLRRARASSSSSSELVVAEDKNEVAECRSGDDKNIPSPRTYDVSITHNKKNQTHLWLTGYDAESKMLLPLDLVLEDIAEFHPQEWVTVGDHPHLAGTHISLYGGLLPSFIEDFSAHLTLQGFQPDVHNYLQLLLEFCAPRIPTIQYRFR